MRGMQIFSGVMLLAMCVWVRADAPDNPATTAASEPAGVPNFMLGEMNIQTFGVVTYCYKMVDTTLEKLGPSALDCLQAVQDEADKGTIHTNGPAILIFLGMRGDPKSTFSLYGGYPIRSGGKVADDSELKISKTKPTKFATIILTGPLANLPEAYDKLNGAILAAGYQPGDESRLFFLYYEKDNSPNNIIQIQIPIH